VVRAAGPAVPVTVKMRAGWDDEVNAVDVARRVVDAGAQAIAVHGRTREQFHKGETRWDVIAGVKRSVSVPVIGNGGVGSAADAAAMVAQTGCDAVMIGRAALGNPWVFQSVATGSEVVPSVRERFEVIRKHVELYEDHAGAEATAREMRKHLGWYLRGLPGSAMVRGQLQSMRHARDLLQVLAAYEEALDRGFARPSPDDFGAAALERSRYGR